MAWTHWKQLFTKDSPELLNSWTPELLNFCVLLSTLCKLPYCPSFEGEEGIWY
jgi:hypothetical protein